MSKRVKLAIVITMVLMFITGSVAGSAVSAAGGLTKLTEAFLNYDISIFIDGKSFQAKDPQDGSIYIPISYKGRTYLPLRAVAEAVGLPVEYDPNEKTAYLGKKPDTSYKPATTTSETNTSREKAGNYLILIESEDQRKSIKKFMDYKESTGFKVTVKSVDSDMEMEYDSDASEAIAQYLHEMDKELSLDYVLLIGNPYDSKKACPKNTGGIIPMKYLYFSDDNHNTRYNYDWYNYRDPSKNAFNTPSDIHYAYEYDWDYDEDGYAGEATEIYNQKNTGSMKLRFLLGRIPFSDNKNIETVLNNTIAFEKSREDHSDVLIASGIINYPESKQFDYIADGAHYAHILSQNLKDSKIENTTLFEKGGLRPSIYECTYPLSVGNFNRELKKKYDMTYSFGHGGTNMMLWENDYNDNGYCDENIDGYDIFSLPTSGFMTGLLYLDGCHTMKVEADTDNSGVMHIQDFMSKGMTCAGVATTRESGFNPGQPQPRIVSYMFKNGSLLVSQEFYDSLPKLILESGNLAEAYIYCYLGDPSIKLKQ